jgi:hypothetical protein
MPWCESQEARSGTQAQLMKADNIVSLASDSHLWVLSDLAQLLYPMGHNHKDSYPRAQTRNCPRERITMGQLAAGSWQASAPRPVLWMKSGVGQPWWTSQLWGWSYTLRAHSPRLGLFRVKHGDGRKECRRLQDRQDAQLQ